VHHRLSRRRRVWASGLDGGTALSGALSRVYDKPVGQRSPPKRNARGRRSPAWTRPCANSAIRGRFTNIALSKTLLNTRLILITATTTNLLTDARVFTFEKRRDGLRKCLTYIAHSRVNGHLETKGSSARCRPCATPQTPCCRAEPIMGTRNLHRAKGPQAVADWMGQTAELADHRYDHARRTSSLLARGCAAMI